MDERGVEVLEAARAEDQNGFAVTTAFAAAARGRAAVGAGALAPELAFGGPPECPDRPLCLPGLRGGLRAGVRRGPDMPSRAATVEALIAGQIDVGLLETTDARLAIAPVMLLTDDRALQPRENVVPLVRAEVADRWGDAADRRAGRDERAADHGRADATQPGRGARRTARPPARRAHADEPRLAPRPVRCHARCDAPAAVVRRWRRGR